MKKIVQKIICGLNLLILTVGIFSFPVFGSHHFESEMARKYPAFDLTDLFVFDSQTKGFTTFIMDTNPQTGKDGKAAFAENGVYSFHISPERENYDKGFTITVYLKGGKMIFGKLDGSNEAVGAKGSKIGEVTVGEEGTLPNGMRVWSGAARDLFLGNAEGIIKYLNNLTAGSLDWNVWKPGNDYFATFNSSIIVVEVPNSMLPKNIWVYASSAVYHIDKWEQVNRLANPLMTHLFMYQHPMDVAEHVAHRPDSDMTRKAAVTSGMLRALVLDGTVKNPVGYADSAATRLLPDLIPFEVGTKAAYTFEKINGRSPKDDGMDTVLSIFMGKKVTDYANTFDRHPSEFPYVIKVKSQ